MVRAGFRWARLVRKFPLRVGNRLRLAAGRPISALRRGPDCRTIAAAKLQWQPAKGVQELTVGAVWVRQIYAAAFATIDRATASATLMPSTAADRMPPA